MKKILMLLLASFGLLTPAVQAQGPYGDDITVIEAHQYMSESGIEWIDVREEKEFEKLPKLDFVHHVPLSRFNADFAELGLDKDTTIFVVCRSGNRSKRVQNALIDAGYTSVTNVKEGMIGWHKEFSDKN